MLLYPLLPPHRQQVLAARTTVHWEIRHTSEPKLAKTHHACNQRSQPDRFNSKTAETTPRTTERHELFNCTSSKEQSRCGTQLISVRAPRAI